MEGGQLLSIIPQLAAFECISRYDICNRELYGVQYNCIFYILNLDSTKYGKDSKHEFTYTKWHVRFLLFAQPSVRTFRDIKATFKLSSHVWCFALILTVAYCTSRTVGESSLFHFHPVPTGGVSISWNSHVGVPSHGQGWQVQESESLVKTSIPEVAKFCVFQWFDIKTESNASLTWWHFWNLGVKGSLRRSHPRRNCRLRGGPCFGRNSPFVSLVFEVI